MIDFAVVVPLFNEEDCIATLRQRVEELLAKTAADGIACEIIIVNDGSTDASPRLLTEQLAPLARVRIITHAVNRGFGAALRTGLEAASATWVATADADTNYDIRELPRLLQIARAGGYDLVTASPWHYSARGHDFPMHRFLLSLGVAHLYRLVSLGKVQWFFTYTAGFRVLDGRRTREILPRSTDFIATAELLVNAAEAGWRIHEEPWPVAQREAGYSKLKTFRTALGHLRHMGRILRRRFSRRNEFVDGL